jgi:hypothetical protein
MNSLNQVNRSIEYEYAYSIDACLMVGLLAVSASQMSNFARMGNTAHLLHSNTKLGAEAGKLKP